MFLLATALYLLPLLSAFISLSFAAPLFPRAECIRTGKVQPGDTCDKLSLRYSISTFQLAQANQGVIDAGCTNLKIDQDVCIANTGMDCQQVYSVNKGDTCNSIAKAFGIETSTLFSNNLNLNNPSCNNLYVGEVVCISKTAYPYPSPSPSPASAASAAPKPTQLPVIADTNAKAKMEETKPIVLSVPVPANANTHAAEHTQEQDGVDYCDDDDTSPQCVDEDSLPYCDEL